MTATRALVTAAWQERWNRQWRFSRAKTGFWLLLVQLAFAGAALWRLHGRAPGAAGFGAALAAMLLQAGGWALLTVFLTARGRLYGGRTLPLLHMAPAAPWSGVAALVLAELPRRAWSMAVWAGALDALLPPGQRWWAGPVLWLAGVAAGTLGQLGGLLLLIAWVRTAPRALNALWAATLILQVVLFYYVVYLVAAGTPLHALGSALRGAQWWLAGGLALLCGVPGLAMLLWLARAPGGVGQAYRDGWLGLADLGDAANRTRRSRWPAAAGGGAGAVQAKEWLYMAHNPFMLFRFGVTAVLLLALIPAGPTLARWAAGRHDLVVLAGGLGLILFAFGEVAGAFFTNEEGRVALYVIAGIRPWRLLMGKLAAASPYALLCGLATWLVALAIGDPFGVQLRVTLIAALTGFGMTAVMVGLAALDAALRERDEEPAAEGVSFILEQVPRGPFSVAGLLLAGAFGAGILWASPPAAWAGLLVVPALALLAGYLHLRRLFP